MSLVTCGRELGGGDSPWETGSGCELVVVIIVDNHQLDQLDHIRIATIIIITCDTGSMPILILFALSASFSQARAKSCSASTDVRWGGVGLSYVDYDDGEDGKDAEEKEDDIDGEGE